MKRIINIKELTPNDTIINIVGHELRYYTYFCVHPHNNQYVFLINNFTQNAEKVYIPKLLDEDSNWFINPTNVDIYSYFKEYYQGRADFYNDLLLGMRRKKN